jgi:hypothetical protein
MRFWFCFKHSLYVQSVQVVGLKLLLLILTSQGEVAIPDDSKKDGNSISGPFNTLQV